MTNPYRRFADPHRIEIRGIVFIEHNSSVKVRANVNEVRGRVPERTYAVPGAVGAFNRAAIIDRLDRLGNGKI